MPDSPTNDDRQQPDSARRPRSAAWVSAWIAVGLGVAAVGAVAFAAVRSGYGLTFKNVNTGVTSDLGAFIGGVAGSLWALAAALFFYDSLRLQQEDLRLQREELKLQKEELKQQRRVMEQQAKQLTKQAKAAKRQLFETSFYNLLENIRRTLSKLRERHPEAVRMTNIDMQLQHFQRAYRWLSGEVPTNVPEVQQDEFEAMAPLQKRYLATRHELGDLTENQFHEMVDGDNAAMAQAIVASMYQNDVGGNYRFIAAVKTLVSFLHKEIDKSIDWGFVTSELSPEEIAKRDYQTNLDILFAELTPKELSLLFWYSLSDGTTASQIRSLGFVRLAREMQHRPPDVLPDELMDLVSDAARRHHQASRSAR